MLGSTFSIAGPNITLNAIVTEELSQFADILEASEDFDRDLAKLIQKTIKEHKRIIFNGNNYSDEWVAEAEKRGLLNLKTTADALPYFVSPKNIELFTKHKIFTETEMHSRYEILMEEYTKTLNIEALTMLDMAKKDIVPAILSFETALCDAIAAKKAVCETIDASLESGLLKKVSELSGKLAQHIEALEKAEEEAGTIADFEKQAAFYKDSVLSAMENLRATVDALEVCVGREYWPYPSYADMIFRV